MSVRFGCQLCFGQRSSLFLIQAREAVPHVAEFGERCPTPTESELQLQRGSRQTGAPDKRELLNFTFT